MKFNRYLRTLAVVAVAGLSLTAFGGRKYRHRKAPVAQPAAVQAETVQRPVIQVETAKTNVVAVVTPRVSRDGEYTDKDNICWYIVSFGTLPKNFITKAEARRLGWQGGPLEPYAPGKSIGGDRFGNYERTLPDGSYRECDVDTRGRPRGAKRIVFSTDRRVYYSDDHYRTFKQLH